MTPGQINASVDMAVAVGVPGGALRIRIDGSKPLSVEPVADVGAVCDSAEDSGEHAVVVVHVSGAPDGSPASQPSVALVSKWERGLRRLERLGATTIAVASGDCGGAALDALLATDYRIATSSVRLLVSVAGGATWPGMGLHRLTVQAGPAAVRQAVLFGRPISTRDALALHLVDELTDDPATALTAVAELVGAFFGGELAIRRQLMLDAQATSFDDALGLHLAACDRALRQVSAEALP